jgi:hypothetical protein
MVERDLNSVASVRVDHAQMPRLAAARERRSPKDKLIEVAECDFQFFVIKSGEIEIRDLLPTVFEQRFQSRLSASARLLQRSSALTIVPTTIAGGRTAPARLLFAPMFVQPP